MGLKNYEPALTDFNGLLCEDRDGTLTCVATDKGDVPIRDITCHYKVLTRNGYRTVLTVVGIVGAVETPYHLQLKGEGSPQGGFWCAPTQEVFCVETQSFLPAIHTWQWHVTGEHPRDSRHTFEYAGGYGSCLNIKGDACLVRAISSIGLGSRYALRPLYNIAVECRSPDEVPEFYANGLLVRGIGTYEHMYFGAKRRLGLEG